MNQIVHRLWPQSTASASMEASRQTLKPGRTTPAVINNRLRSRLASLPPEIKLLIASHLTYPDALSLKHTDRCFYSLVYTGVQLKVEWLVERRTLHLECPNDRRCDLGSDLRFCRGSVPLLMRRRREHMECESRPNLGCLVYGTPTCTHKPRMLPLVHCGRWLKSLLRQRIELWSILLVLLPVMLAWVVYSRS